MHNPLESLSQMPYTHHSAQIEDYLDHLCVPMVSKMTYEQRMAVREEIRTQLLALVAAHEELGSSREEAIQAAIQQFAKTKQMEHALLADYRKPYRRITSRTWPWMHAAIGGVFGSLALISMDCLVHYTFQVANLAILFDCLVGMALGWIPAVWLQKRPASPLRAALGTGLFYLVPMTGLMAFASIASGHTGVKDIEFALTCIFSTGIMGALGGAVMSRLFPNLQNFAPRSQPLLPSSPHPQPLSWPLVPR